MRRFGMLAAFCGFVAVVAMGDAATAAPNAVQRRELAAIRRELAKVPGLLRRRKGDEARKTVEAAEARLKKLLDAAPALARDRSVLFIKRLLDAETLRVRKAVGKAPVKTPVANPDYSSPHEIPPATGRR